MSEKNEIVEIVEAEHLDTTKAQELLTHFATFFDEVKMWEKDAKAIVVKDITQVKEMGEARAARLALKEIRVNAEKMRKELKEQSLREGRAIDGVANVLKALIVPLEEHLEKQENFAEVQENERKNRLQAEREEALRPYVSDTSFYNLREMSQEGFDELLKSSKMAREATEAADKKTKEMREEQEKTDREERERIKAENEALKKKEEEKDKELAKEREAKEKAEGEIKAREDAEKQKKEDQKRLAKETRYKNFLKEHGCTEKDKKLFHIEKVGNEVKLYKIVGVFKIEE